MMLAVPLSAAAILLATPANVPADLAVVSSADYLPAENEIPAGFVHLRERDSDRVESDVVAAYRWYARPNPDVAEDAMTSLQLGVTVARSPERASEILGNLVAVLDPEDYVVRPLPEQLGDEAIVGRKRFDVTSAHPTESIVVYFRVGAVNALVHWYDAADRPNVERALEIARLIEARIPQATSASSVP